jgi:hypothetical protein
VQYHNRLCDYLNTFDKAFVVHADNVGSKQMSDIRAVSCSARHSGRRHAVDTSADVKEPYAGQPRVQLAAMHQPSANSNRRALQCAAWTAAAPEGQ